jgi:hypothetical protein
MHLVINVRNQFIAELCHIEAAAPGGPRYNREMSDEARRADPNLILLCHQHHVETDDAILFSADALREMKRVHEARFATLPYEVPDTVLREISREVEEYWARVDRANSVDHIVPDLRVPIDVAASIPALLAAIQDTLGYLHDQHHHLTVSHKVLSAEVRNALEFCGYDLRAWDEIPHHLNPTVGRDWETMNLALPNLTTRLSVLVRQVELRVLEAQLSADPSNSGLRERVVSLRADFLDGASRWGLVD